MRRAETFESFQYLEKDPNSLSHDYILSIYETADGTLWVGTEGGLNRFDAGTETFEVLSAYSERSYQPE